MATNLQAHRSMLTLTLIVAIGLLPLMFGLMVMSLQLDRQLETNARTAVEHTLLAVDRLLDHMQIATLEAPALSDKPGDETLASVKVELARDQAMQTLTRNHSELTLRVELAGMAIWGYAASRDDHKALENEGEFLQRAHSNKYGYTVQGSYHPGHTGRQARHSMLQVLPSLALVSILTGATCYLGMARPRRLREAQSSA